MDSVLTFDDRKLRLQKSMAALVLASIALGAPQSTLGPCGGIARSYAQSANRGGLLPAPDIQWDGRSLLTIRLPTGANTENHKFRIGIFEAGRAARAGEIQRNFDLVGGAWQAQFRVEADPGRYQIRLLSSDKSRVPLSQSATLVVSGIHREAGVWLKDASPFWNIASSINTANAPAAIASNVPLFVGGLKRDNRSSKAPSVNIPTPGGEVSWRVLELPPLIEAGASSFDATRWRDAMASRIAAARARGERGFLGCALPIGADFVKAETPIATAQVATALRETRRALTTLAPDAALILEVRVPLSASDQERVARLLDAAAPFCDAVALQVEGVEKNDEGAVGAGATDGLWALKAARRVAEEQANYDLPIFWHQSVGEAGADLARQALMNGATGIIDDFPSNAPADNRVAPTPENDSSEGLWRATLARNAPLFIGAVTLEDSGILPSQSTLDGFAPRLDRWLREMGRVPLLARGLATTASRAVGEADNSPLRGRAGESLWTQISPATTVAELMTLREAARAGGHLFVQGTARRGDNDIEAAKWDDALGVVSRSIAPVRTTMKLDDPWLFGVARGTSLPIEQSVALILKAQPPQSEKERRRDDAKDKTPRPRVAATFADNSPAIVVTNIEKGEIAWMPNALPLFSSASTQAGSENDLAFLGAIASSIQPALVRVRERNTPLSTAVATDAQSKNNPSAGSDIDLDAGLGADASGVRVAVRSSRKGTLLIAVFNSQPQARRLTLSVQVAAGIALDLADSSAMPVRTRGFASSIDLDLPAAGWKLIALSTSRAVLDEERDAPLLKIRLR